MSTLNWQLDHSYARLPSLFHVEQAPGRVRRPQLILWNTVLADELGLQADQVPEQDLAQIFSGHTLPEQTKPLAQAYAGHQFGHFTMLGDGRALLLGEQLTPSGKRMDIQLKGAGRTAFSRQGDGLAGLGPMLREYLMSEAMHALGVPTTRALAVVTTGERVWREEVLDGAVLTRVASSHLRVGTFEYAAARNEPDALKALIDYALQRHDPELVQAPNKALALLQAVMQRQIRLVLQWMRVGFIHGVMNTDNMTISGETIDYGPCAFMDRYDPATVFSSIDRQGRYAFGNQPRITQWNLVRFAQSLLSEVDADTKVAVSKAKEVLEGFESQFLAGWLEMMAGKLGLVTAVEDDRALMQELLDLMQEQKRDYTGTFQELAHSLEGLMQRSGASGEKVLLDPALDAWAQRWHARVLEQEGGSQSALARMQGSNPVYIPRNHLVEDALLAATTKSDFEVFETLLQVLSRPYEEQADKALYASPGTPGQQESHRTFCGT